MIRKLLLIAICFSSLTTTAQNNASNSIYFYKDLSSIYYAKQIDSLKKALVAPKLYSKETQKKYEEYYGERVASICNALKNNEYLYSQPINDYISSILKEIITNNKNLISNEPLLLLDRNSSVNAYTCGFGVIAVNMGLLDFAKSKEELAFILAHELSHQVLNHPENADKKRAEWITSDEYKKKLNDISNSEFQKLTQLSNLFKSFTFSKTRHSRFNESVADSLAIVFLKNAKMPFNANWLLRLDSSDNEYKTDLKQELPSYFKNYNIDINASLFEKKYVGLSAKKYNFKDTTTLEDSLKTHPDCIVRYKTTLQQTTPNINETPIPANIKVLAKKIMLWNLFDDKHLTSCAYRVLLEKDNGNMDSWYDFMLHNVLFGLVYSSKQYKRFNAINIKPKELISKKYYQLQTMFEQVSTENLESYFAEMGKGNFWNNLTADDRAFKNFITEVIAKESMPKEVNSLANSFTKQYEQTFFIEFVNHFKK